MDFSDQIDDYEAQYNDQLQTEIKLEALIYELECSCMFDDDDIALLRHACGLPKKQSPSPLNGLFNDFGQIFGK